MGGYASQFMTAVSLHLILSDCSGLSDVSNAMTYSNNMVLSTYLALHLIVPGKY